MGDVPPTLLSSSSLLPLSLLSPSSLPPLILLSPSLLPPLSLLSTFSLSFLPLSLLSTFSLSSLSLLSLPPLSIPIIRNYVNVWDTSDCESLVLKCCTFKRYSSNTHYPLYMFFLPSSILKHPSISYYLVINVLICY